ncbi:MAG: 3'(2'),5'-bisphosphate nucleotidase CysQ [Bacteroidales bacterium]|nr:3'(2'),5'-bisphosphate nucleotidase CysQ [Bacteroidales bacterium]
MHSYYDTTIKAALEAGEKILEVYNSGDFQVSEKSDKSPLTLADREAHHVIVRHLSGTGIPVLSEEGRDTPYKERSQWKSFWLVDPLDGTREFIKRNGEFTVNIALIRDHAPVFGVVYAPVPGELYAGLNGEGAWLIKDPDRNITMEGISSGGTRLPVFGSQGEKDEEPYRVVASRSHLNQETEDYIDQLRSMHSRIEKVSKGSSLKLCMVASGYANEYPRLGPTMEWDVAAAHAVVRGAGKTVRVFGTNEELSYNKENLLNPFFLVI